MNIRKATLKDLPQLVKLYIEYQKEEEKLASTGVGRMNYDQRSVSQDLKSFILKRNKILLIMIDEDKIIGLLLGSFAKIPTQRIEDRGFLNEIYIVPKMRGKGFSSKLKDEFIEWVKKRKSGAGAISLYVMPKNKKALGTYKKWGFRISYLNLTKELN